MSYILEALKKAERERHRGEPPGVTSIQRPGGEPRRWRWRAWVAVALFVNAGLLAALLRWPGRDAAEQPAAKASPGMASGQTIPRSAATQPVSRPRPAPPAASTAASPPLPEGKPAEAARGVPAENKPQGVPAVNTSPALPERAAPAPDRKEPAGAVLDREARATRSPSPPQKASARTRLAAPKTPAPAVARTPATSGPSRPSAPRSSPKAGETPRQPSAAALPRPEPPRPPAPAASPAPPSAPPATAPLLTVPTLDQLPAKLRESLPDIRLDALLYAERPAERMLFIDGRRYREGDTISGGPRIEQIRRDGAILSYQGERFMLHP
jgi:general secretion pathway protein B